MVSCFLPFSFRLQISTGNPSAEMQVAVMNTLEILKVPAVNGTVLAVTIFSQIQVVLSCILLAATIFWTCIKIAKALRDFNGKD